MSGEGIFWAIIWPTLVVHIGLLLGAVDGFYGWRP